MSENTNRPRRTEKNEQAQRSDRYSQPENREQIRDDSVRDGRRRRMRRARTIREVTVIGAVVLITIVTVLLVRKCTGEGEKPPETKGTETFDPSQPATGTSDTDPAETDPIETDPVETAPLETDPVETPPTESESVPEPTAPRETSGNGFPAKMNLTPGLSANPQGGIRIPSWIVQDLLPIDGIHGREGTAISPVKHVVIHYVGNTLSQAKDNRDYFAYQTDGRNVSSHFVVGLYGEIIQCVPVTEVSHAQGVKSDSGRANHNYDAISVETCHYNDAGQFTNETYQSLVRLTAFLLQQYGLPATGSDGGNNRDDSGTILMHFHCSGKACPKFWADNPHYYNQFVADVRSFMEQHPNIGAEMP